jgi:hypothetical protein
MDMRVGGGRLRLTTAVALLAVLVVACRDTAPNPVAELTTSAAPTQTDTATPKKRSHDEATTSEDSHGPSDLKEPPPVTVSFGDQSFQLDAWTYCYKNGCADGGPPKNPLSVGGVDEVRVGFPLDGWSFKAIFSRAGEDCARAQQVRLEDTGHGQFLLRPAGYADTYDVTLFGRGDGDLFTTFRWTTPADGPLPKPTARAAIISKGDGGPNSYGIELSIDNLARTPRHADARITVRSDNGESLTFKAQRARGRCFPEGSLYWDGPDDQGYAASRLGKSPFTYKVRLTLDGQHYFATATWPEDEIKGNEPSVRLVFRPSLPALD